MGFTGGYRHKGAGRSSAQSWASACGWAMTESLKVINRNQKLRALVRTGALRGSISFEIPQATSTRVEGVMFAGGSGAPYAKAREFGTGLRSEAEDSKHSPIVIVPTTAKALAWPAPGMGTPGGPNLRLSGNLRTHVRRALVQGLLKPADVFVFRSRVVQEGQLTDRYMRGGLEDSVEEMMEYAREAGLRVLGLGYRRAARAQDGSGGGTMDELRSRSRVGKLELVYCQRCGKPLARVSLGFKGAIEFRCPRCHSLTMLVGQVVPERSSATCVVHSALAVE